MGRYTGKSCRFAVMIFMTSTFFLVELITGYVTNSLALVSDSFHMLSDIIALVIGFLAMRVSIHFCHFSDALSFDALKVIYCKERNKGNTYFFNKFEKKKER